ncbi:Hypothetical protein PHPALM_37533 [Phytophthora palmivora]|uniref:Uncharacterized protein n=1 Tax=Phytophthora palmivora TaxID=4796 RepID=A0A2P4WX68_9STRA|nr:Hypothetical protein PHPALM_37533 [Phytophthora palmivora]
MELFLDDGFVLDTTEVSYRDQVLSLGTRAEKCASVLCRYKGHHAKGRRSTLTHRLLPRSQRPRFNKKTVLMFREEYNIGSRGSGAVLKHLCSLHRVAHSTPKSSAD